MSPVASPPLRLSLRRHLGLALFVIGAGAGALPACAGQPADKEAPKVEILTPQTGALLGSDASGAIDVRVRITDNVAVARAALTVGGVSTPIDLAALGPAGETTVRVHGKEGANRIVATAADDAGSETAAEVEVRLDATAPAFAVLAPITGFSETRRLLRATVTDGSGIATLAYSVNGGAPVDVATAPGQTEAVIAAALPLRPGDNTVTLQVTDTVGNRREESISFRYGLTTTGGGAHSGAVVGGKLLVWGRYNVGQLGLGGTVGDAQSRLSPEAVPAFGASGTQVAAVSFNQNQSLAVRSDGTVFTWGANGSGELGLGDTTQRTTPVQIAGLTDAVYGVLGYSHGLALRADGSVVAWGKNGLGQVGVAGDGTATDVQTRPVPVSGLPGNVVEVLGGAEHSAALTADGTVYVWGRNSYGNLGIGTPDTLRHPVPMPVPGLTDVVDIASGRDHILALKADGTVVSWGLGSSGQLGYGDNTDPKGEDRAAPVTVVRDAQGSPLGDMLAVFANGNSSYGLRRDGQYLGWGQNFSGQLAVGQTTSEEWVPVRAAVYTPGDKPVYLDEIVQLGAIGTGATHTIARARTGEIYAWGWNFRGSLGVPTLANAWAQTSPLLLTLPQ